MNTNFFKSLIILAFLEFSYEEDYGEDYEEIQVDRSLEFETNEFENFDVSESSEFYFEFI